MSLYLPRLKPMLLDDRKRRPFSGPKWLFELKYDGWRVLAEFGTGEVDMRTRNGHRCIKWFPEVAVALSKLGGGPHFVDGEVCVLDDLGRSDFDRLQSRAVRHGWYEGADPVAYCVFDLLVEGGTSIMSLPLRERTERL